MAELLLGCGNHRDKLLRTPDRPEGWTELVTLDIDPRSKPDVLWDIASLPLPFDDEQFDEIHAYHVLEHVGAQGDAAFFFAQWSDFYRLLKPGGIVCGAVPAPASVWLFGDPGHTRVLPPEILTFLDQTEYDKQVGVTALADYRRLYRADFTKVFDHVAGEAADSQFFFIVQAVKPSRITV